MWIVFFFISFLALALLIPTGVSLVPVWRKARVSRHVDCPASGHSAIIDLDPWYAVTTQLLGDPKQRIQDCSRWPQVRSCARNCHLT
jgi:hypothetical protein